MAQSELKINVDVVNIEELNAKIKELLNLLEQVKQLLCEITL